MKIIPISIPTPFIVGAVNVYLIAGEPLTLVDTGPKTAEALAALKDGLALAGYKISEIRRLIITHAHEDHCGLVKTILDGAPGAEVLIHPWERGHLFGRLELIEGADLLHRAGVPLDVQKRIHDFYEGFRQFTDVLPLEAFTELRDNAEIEFASGAWRIVHTPGHTPGSCSLFREANRTLIAGDCVLKRITPNPILAPDPLAPARRFPSLGEYLVSLAKIRQLAPTLIYGGHGETVTDYEELFHRQVRAIDERQTQIISLVDSEGVTAYQAAGKMFPDSATRDTQTFLTVSEAAAHLDYAAANGKVEIELKDGIEFYKK